MEITFDEKAATVIAAFIAFIYSFVNMLVSKDQKTTEFRQAWIDSLREEIANLVSFYGYLATQSERYKSDDSVVDPKSKFLDEQGETIKQLATCMHKIQLRLNIKDNRDKQLLELLRQVEDNVQFESISTTQAGNDNDKIIAYSQELLKTEWTRVKRGEKLFFVAKWVFLLSLLYLAYQYLFESLS
ncbi:hypothetical protein [Vibrio parahaemolyticus]|uniref:hypothetical protein n=1 Tax=Vibrio parahaemolyticus TaxID=670 RepID=UPI00111E63E2|nr:hypothetical protein [Vibrio parahaemolyticus]TOQ72405.1 hypothetical protein CGG89_08155 [Vibrio parahaemolyticus]